MKREEAIRILDPETSAEALAEIEYYACFRGKEAKIKAVEDACILAIASLREQEQRRLIPVTDRLPEPTERAICINDDGDMMIGTYTEWGWIFPFYFKEPTYWMPLPEPPRRHNNGC